MRSVMVAGVAAVALTLGGCGMFDGKSSSSTSANDQPSTPSTNSTYSGTGSNNAAGAANRTAAPMSPSAEQSGTSASRSSSRTSAGSADVRGAQQELQSAGLYKGKIDGVDGPKTRQALMSFQKKNGLPQTGKLDPATMAQLQSGSSSSGSSTPGASAPSKGSNSSGAPGTKQQ